MSTLVKDLLMGLAIFIVLIIPFCICRWIYHKAYLKKRALRGMGKALSAKERREGEERMKKYVPCKNVRCSSHVFTPCPGCGKQWPIKGYRS